MLCRTTQDGWVMLESSNKTWSTGEGKGKPLQYSCLENPMNGMKRDILDRAKDTDRLKERGRKKTFHVNRSKKKAGVAKPNL